MENIDIIILNLIVVVSFIAFFVSTFKAFEKVNKIGIKNLEKKGIITRLSYYFESLL